ncbi:MAG: hypothetical protein HY270_18140 [Deltaproteobacteria bacterium]|nr:hypothetical protein [Deltaproteobacteria bacterium]
MMMKVGTAVLLAFLWQAHGVWAACGGDCSGDGEVTVDELVLSVNIALGNGNVSQCQNADTNGDGEITIDELIAAVGGALNGCPAAAATPTATATATPHAEVTPTPQIVPPGISTQLLGTFSGQAVNDNTHVNKAVRLKIAVVGNSIIVTDLGANLFATGSTLTVNAVAPTAINSTRTIGSIPSGSIEIFQLALVPDGSGLSLAGTYSKSPILNPLDMTNVFALILHRES